MQHALPSATARKTRKAVEFLFVLIGLLWGTTAQAQLSVSGTVTSGEDQNPLPGVNILVRGTTLGTITDAAGKFQINTNSADDILVFSFVGFVSQEVALAGRTTVNIVLASDAKQLSEVVVTALGVEKDVAKLGYTTQKVQGADLIKAREPNPINSLVGKVAGLTVGTSSEMLGAPQLVLRGENSLLIVVDGVPIVSDTWNISPDDVETYTVLKGPNAAALYGSRGRNGAIIITTKKGTKDRRGFAIDFNSSTMMEKGFVTIPTVQNEYGGGEYNTYRFGDDEFGQVGGWNQNDYDVWGPRLNGQLISQYDSPVDPTTGIRSATPYVPRGKDNLQKFIQTGLLSTNNIAISSATDKYDIRASLTHTYQKGIVPTTRLEMNNFNITMGYNFTPKLRLESNLNYNRQYTPNFPDVTYGPNSMIYNIDIWGGADWDINDLRDNMWQPGKVGVQQRNYEYYRYNNPWVLAREWKRGHYKTDIYGYIALKYTITPWLKASVRSQITSWDLFRSEKFPYSADVYGREQKQGDYREDRRDLFENNTDVMFNVNKDFGSKFNLTGLVGANLRTYSYNSTYATTDYLNAPGVYNFGNSKNPAKVYNYTAPMQVGSAYYSFDLSYKNIVTLSNTGRLDKYSTFYAGHNKGFYPSVSLSTVLSNFITMPEFISFMKLRASYANVKNAFTVSTIGPAWGATGGNPLSYGSTYTTAYDGPLYSSNTYQISKPYNNQGAAYYSTTQSSQSYKPSQSSSSEAGIDMKFLENRLGLDVTYYDATVGPYIVTEQWSEASGFKGGITNGIQTEKKGWEVALSGTPVRNSNGFTWNVGVNWSKYVQRYKEFYNGLNEVNGAYLTDAYSAADSRISYKVGDRVDGLYGYKFFRDPSGQIIHDNTGMIYANNRVAQLLGHANPDWVWSVINTVSYKNFSLNFQFDGRVGGVAVDYVYKKLLQGGRDIETVQGAYGAARLAEFQANEGNDPSIHVPTYVGNGVMLTSGTPNVDASGHITNMSELGFAQNNVKTSLQDYINRETGFDERTLISKTYAKLRQVTLTYNLPSATLERIGIRQASVSLVGRNLLYFAKRKDIDLDSFIGTSTASQLLQSPTMRRYGFNINLTF